ncbi:hypothetical protein [Pseudacidovorax sp. NFM-22]|uniref:hypothetical protein n=1 Tax=Pseudacidovorax sp. NFM-22 TaxID=2744469 RepID=UPI001F435409|nr:hypothetical protein [Pseudacidovorax sp. NFM-22]
MHNTFKACGCAATLLALALGVHAGGTSAPTVSGNRLVTAPVKMNGSGVILQYSVAAASQVGETVPLLLVFSGVGSQGAIVKLQPEPGLTLDLPSPEWSLPAGRSSWTVHVTPQATGTAYLNVFITQGGAATAASIPIQIGTPSKSLPPSSLLKEAPGGEKMILMPVK